MKTELKLIDLLNKDFVCPTCKELATRYGWGSDYHCNKTPLHISYMFVTLNSDGKDCVKFYGMSKTQKMFLDGYWAAQEGVAKSKDPYFQGIMFNAGHDSYSVINN